MNLKPQDLRLGNWVSYEGQHYQMAVISIEGEPGLNTIEYGYGVCEWKDLEPIPLTVEWLEKLGFNLETYKLYNRLPFYAIDGKEIIIVLEDGFAAYNCIWWNYLGHTPLVKDADCWELMEIKYLHQLQNLYHVFCNEELEIS